MFYSLRKIKKVTVFYPEDIENLKIIFHLWTTKALHLKVQRPLKNNSTDVKENQKIIASLEKLKDFLLK